MSGLKPIEVLVDGAWQRAVILADQRQKAQYIAYQLPDNRRGIAVAGEYREPQPPQAAPVKEKASLKIWLSPRKTCVVYGDPREINELRNLLIKMGKPNHKLGIPAMSMMVPV